MILLGKVSAVIFVIGICALCVSCEVSLWNECRADHSWWYCARVLGK